RLRSVERPARGPAADRRVRATVGVTPAQGPGVLCGMMPRFMGLFAFLLVLFAASGCAALIYEIIWFQLLQLVIGASSVSLGTLLATYMGGLCLGSLAYSKLIPARRNPLQVYAVIEAGIGVCGLAVLFGMPWIDRVYSTHAGHGLVGIVMRAV